MQRRSRLFPTITTNHPVQPQVVAYYFKQWQGFHMAFHTHDATEIMYTIQGVCDVEMDRTPDQTDTVRLKKGEFILLDANVPHRLIVGDDEPCRMLNCEFRFAAQQGLMPSIQQLASNESQLASLLEVETPYLVLRDPDEVYHVMKSVVLELDKGQERSETMVQLLLAQLLIRIARLQRETVSGRLIQSEFYVRQSMDYMLQNYDREIQVKDIALAVNLHPGYLQRVFKAVTGQTLVQYLTAIRMEKAQMLLLETDIPISDISEYVGIGSRQYFHMLFKAHTNTTPTEYRNSMNTHKLMYPEGS
ncbi:AraC family transcriptional regulator [Paenibacillus roseipurpureus]|uniref:AraC family transcriptional regulator n=1 Tax=Paenibacillus roseopurpureus TaxID=2918901 RepID=A0AA96LTP1_9BACL|nr:AraC family transcriptional regulator [Paenibacillus sp. MBLB1832]WNR46316.1 AraC family transcriptional regulator [Paenibacillus sp. MBLB1832]